MRARLSFYWPVERRAVLDPQRKRASVMRPRLQRDALALALTTGSLFSTAVSLRGSRGSTIPILTTAAKKHFAPACVTSEHPVRIPPRPTGFLIAFRVWRMLCRSRIRLARGEGGAQDRRRHRVSRRDRDRD